MKNSRLFILSIILALPLIAFLIHHYTAHAPDLIPTGFTQDDDVVYVSNARQHLEGKPGLTYSNSFSSSPSAPSIYSQPYNFLLCIFLSLKIQPGLILSLFGLISAITCIFFSLKLVNYLYPKLPYRNTIFLLLIWGGGVTALGGLIANQTLFKGTYPDFWDGIYMADPGNGWWGMNFGRVLVISTEAFYHLLFMAGIFLIIKHRWLPALIISFLISWSHPFTGVEYLLIICGWLFIEKIFFRNNAIPWWVFGSFYFLFFLHLYYYLIFLNQFPEHKKLFEVFSVNWSYSYRIFIPAYFLVGFLAVFTFYRQKLKSVFAKEHQRLFFAWAIIAFLLSNHEWFIKPIQPIHFTRGYIWLGLFLFAIPGLIRILDKIKKQNLILVSFVLLFLSDNILWYANILKSKEEHETVSHISKDTQEVLNWLAQNTTTNDLLVSNEYVVSYMANAYASSYSWTGHLYNTPDFSTKKEQALQFLKTGIPLPDWKGRRLLILIDKRQTDVPVITSLKNQKLFDNNRYEIFAL
jgi:hypothetical protein